MNMWQLIKGLIMGGEREKVLKAADSNVPGASLQISDIRLHESKGKVHLHDDKSQKKCVVSAGDFWLVWENFKKDLSDEKTTTIVDIHGKTCAKLMAHLTQGKLDIDLCVDDIEFGKNFQLLDDFASGK